MRQTMDQGNLGSTFFLKLVLAAIAVAALIVSIFALPSIAAKDIARHPQLAWQFYPFLAYAYTLSIVFLFALFQGYKLLTYVDQNKVFSEASLKALKYIKRCAYAVTGLIVPGVLLVMGLSWNKGEDITGIVMMGIIITLTSGVVAAVVGVAQHHVQKAVAIKSENDLTV